MKYIPEELNWEDSDQAVKTMDNNLKRLKDIDNKAYLEGKLLWRVLQEGYADGYAYYQITKVNKKTVRVEVCTGIGDDWVLPYWGEKATIPKEYVEKRISI